MRRDAAASCIVRCDSALRCHGTLPMPHFSSSACWPCVLQMVEMASKKFVCIVDDTKLVEGLGGSGGD